MIKIKTVFVLGAGASMPYGLPSGAELRNKICESAYFDSPMMLTLMSECGVNKQEYVAFTTAFTRSSQQSIDTFLAKRPDFAEIGKLAIAYELCRREIPSRIFDSNNDDHWYMALWAAMERDIHKHTGLRNNNIRFVTFNYDRSLEFFLHEAAKHTFNLSDEDAMGTWQHLPILHVYGSLGDFLPIPSENTRPYVESVNEAVLRLAASALYVIPEARQDDKNFQTAQNWFEWAERICFLGFGFDALNMERLGIADVLSHVKKAHSPT
ncbi:MAG: hypothetical protein ACYC4K_08960, partial [Thiobacillus sp.]